MADLSLGSAGRPLRVAIFGSGPSGFYAADALQKVGGLHCAIDMFDRLPTPFGLVRGGVAPDHQKIKSVVAVYERIAAHDGFRFFGNTTLGRDLQVEDLDQLYDAWIYAVGNESDRRLDVPGIELQGIHTATEFVGWYNAHPDYANHRFDLESTDTAVVIGNGNVAMDVCRVLLQDPERLAVTDIGATALAAVRRSTVRTVVLVGRRGPAQAAFSPKEIKELATLEGVHLQVDPAEVEISDVTRNWLESGAPRSAAKNLDYLTACAKGEGPPEGAADRQAIVRFCRTPVAFAGQDGRVTAIKVQKAELHPDDKGVPRPRLIEEFETIPCGLVFQAIGYRGVAIPGVPFDEGWGVIPNRDGRVLNERDGAARIREYVVGWAKRGPTGLIGTNSPDSKATVECLVEDISSGALQPVAAPGDAATLLRDRGVRFTDLADWHALDQWEQQQGAAEGRIRLKLERLEEQLDRIEALRSR